MTLYYFTNLKLLESCIQTILCIDITWHSLKEYKDMNKIQVQNNIDTDHSSRNIRI